MTFPSAVGYGNLPQGNFSPELFSKLLQLDFRRTSVVENITNTEYGGELTTYGQSVRILKEPNIQVSPYVRGQQVQSQDLADDDFTLEVDNANYFSWQLDDIEDRQSHIAYEAVASDRGSYELANTFDKNILQYMIDNAGVDNNTTVANQLDFSNMIIGATPTTKASPTPIGLVTDGSQDNSNTFSALSVLNRAKRLMDVRDVPQENRWFVGDPIFYEKLGDEDSKVLNGDFVDKGDLRTGMLYGKKLRGFELWHSNNLPIGGAGPEGIVDSNWGWLIAGHRSAVATAEQLLQVESFRSQITFADVARGLHVFGRKLLRPESLVIIAYNSATT